MRQIILTGLVCALCVMVGHAQSTRALVIGPYHYVNIIAGLTATATQRLDADTEQIACKFYAKSTSAVTAIDLNMTVGGTVTDTTFAVEIQTDTTDAPSGSLAGTGGTIAGAAATGFQGSVSVSSGALVVNTPYWVVARYASGGSLSGTDYWELRHVGTGVRLNRDKIRHHNGTNWTTTAAVSASCGMVRTHADASMTGHPHTAAVAVSAQADIFINAGNSQQQGIRYKLGSRHYLQGWLVHLTKTGSPSDLVVTTYEGSTSKATCTLVAAEVSTLEIAVCWQAPVALAANTNIYGILSQAGTSDANDWDLRTYAANSTYIGAVLASDMRMVAGTGADPTAFSVITTEIPIMWPIVSDLAVDIDDAAATVKRCVGC